MTKIKICGLTTEEDIALVNRLNIDLAGFVLFFPKSRRNLPIDRAAGLVSMLDGVKSVAVTVSPDAGQVKAVSDSGFDYIQIHGELKKESYEACGIPIIRAFNVANMGELSDCAKLEKIAGYVFDAAEPGSGKTFDWSSMSRLERDGKMFILAGGLSPDNVSAAIEAVNPDGVDVSSGVELPRGGKDARLAELFVEKVREKDGKGIGEE